MFGWTNFYNQRLDCCLGKPNPSASWYYLPNLSLWVLKQTLDFCAWPENYFQRFFFKQDKIYDMKLLLLSKIWFWGELFCCTVVKSNWEFLFLAEKCMPSDHRITIKTKSWLLCVTKIFFCVITPVYSGQYARVKDFISEIHT